MRFIGEYTMNTHLQVQQLQIKDWSRLKAIRLTALNDSPDAFAITLTSTNERTDIHWQQLVEDVATFIATVSGNDVGLAGCARDKDHPDHAFLVSMWVSPGVRNSGVGKALIEAVITKARAEGCKKLLLDVGDENTNAIALYESMNFQPTGQTGTLPPPRTHIREHRRALLL